MLSFKQLPTDKNQFLIPLSIFIIALIAFIFNNSLESLFIYHRQDIANGELWQLFTGHFFHTNLNHLLLNLGALGLLWLLHGHFYTSSSYSIVFVFCALVTSICIYLFTPSISQYVGLSGVLHGIFIWGALLDIKDREKTGYLLFIGVWLKVAHEQFYGASADVVQMIDANVAIDAHLYGTISGTIIGVVLLYTPIKHLSFLSK